MTGLSENGETVIMGAQDLHHSITDALQDLKRYKPPHCLGDASQAILQVSEMDPNNLEKLKSAL